MLSTESWSLRHRGLVTILWLHVPALGLFGLARSVGLPHLSTELLAIVLLAGAASWGAVPPRFRSLACAIGLITCSALLVHLSGGYIEMHFHFFVMIGVLTLYQDWLVFLIAIAYVALHHGVVGVLDPRSVYNHPDAWAHPWTWALIHAGFVLAASAAGIANWKFSERAQERVRRSQEETRRIIETANDAFIAIDETGLIVDWNQSAVDLFGWQRPEALGRSMPELIIPERYRDSHRRGVERFLATGEGPVLGSRVELSAIRRSGEEFPAELTIWAVRTGERWSFNAFVRDIGQRRAADRAIERARSDAEEANLAKSVFLSRMSHELRTPLTAILGFGQLLQMDDLAPDHEESVRHILRAGRHLLDLINEVLDIARIEAGEMSLSIETVDLNEVIAESVDLIRSLAEQRSITLEAVGNPSEFYVLADRQRLKQILLNLLSNAVKYNVETGYVRISYEQTTAGAVRVSVRDTGPGIPPERIERLFVPFDRLGAEQTDVEGTGIGLALSKRLVEVMAGTIGLDSEPGRGSTFWIELQEAPPSPLPEAVPGSETPTEIAAAKEVSRRLLYVEDNPSNLRLVERLLHRRPDIQLITAMQGRLGLDLAREHRPDLILLDLNLPDMLGSDVLRELKADPDTAGIPIVVLSADATVGALERLLAAGAHAYLTKPIDLKKLLEAVDETIQTKVA
jgi:PAS domain S-box-containing protein